MSIPFSVAATLARGAIEEDNYARIDDPDILHLITLIDLKDDAGLTAAFPGAQGAEVTVRLHSGETIQRRLDDVIAATPQQVCARFREAAAAAIGAKRAQKLEELVDNCEALPDGSGIAAYCRLEQPSPGRNPRRGISAAARPVPAVSAEEPRGGSGR